MKKLVVTLLTVLACGSAYALPVGNPADASLLCNGMFWEGNCCMDPCDPCASWCDAISFRFGFYGDYVFNRHLEITNDDFDADGSIIEHSQVFTNAGYLALNFWNRLDIFATLGASNFAIDTGANAYISSLDDRYQLVTSSHFSWSVGARATLWECGCTAVGIEGQYFSFNPNVKWASVLATTGGAVYPDDVVLNYREWQVGLGLSHRINMFVPYVAVKYARANVGFENSLLVPILVLEDSFEFNRYYRSSKNWGYAVGVTLVNCEKVSVTAEGRFADEKALHVNAQLRF